MKVVLKQTAKRDLRRIGDWIAQDNPKRAVTFVAELEAKAADLADLPLRFPVLVDTPEGPVHKRVHGKYLIYYRVYRARIEVIGFKHGAQAAVEVGR